MVAETMSASRRLACWLGVVSSALCVGGLLVLVDLAQVGQILRTADPRFVALLSLVVVLTYPVRSYRWGVLVHAVTPARQLHLLSGMSVGLMANMVLPARVGDIARGVLIAKRTEISATTGITTVAAEHFLDIAANTAILALLLTSNALPAVSTPVGARGLAGLVFVGAGAVVLFVSRPGRAAADRLAGWAGGFASAGLLTRLQRLKKEIARGLQGLRQWRVAGGALAISLVLWALLGLLNHVALLALGIRLPLQAAYVAMLAQTVGVAVPSSPGYIGTFHVATIAALSLYGVDADTALGLALLLHTLSLLTSVAIGLPFLWYEGLSLRQLRRSADTSVVPLASV